MAATGKLYKFYLGKIFRKNWLRITIVSLFVVGLVWFGLPYLFYKGSGKIHIQGDTEKIEKDERLTDEEKKKLKERIKTESEKVTFRDFNQVLFGTDKTQFLAYNWKISRRLLKEDIELLAKEKAAGASEKRLEEIKGRITAREIFDSGLKTGNFNVLLTNADNCFFFNQTDDYLKEENFWKLLNNISWWNLTGFIVLFWLVFNVLDSTFSKSKREGEETMVVSFTPGVKRSEIFAGKVLAFLTFYSLINIFLFLVPYGFYYFWIAKETSLGGFALLSLYTTIIGPALFFGLILAPYLFLNSFSGFLGGVISSLVVFFPSMWFAAKKWIFGFQTWPYKLENWFFNPIWFTIISLVCGIVFLYLYYWKYQEEDLV